MKIPSVAGVLLWVRERFLLGAAERASHEAHAAGASTVAARHRHLQAARRHQEAARELSRPRHSASSLILYRAAVAEALAALTPVEIGGAPPNPPARPDAEGSPFSSTDTLTASLTTAGVDEHARGAARRAFFEIDDAALTELRWGEVHELLTSIDALATRLIEGVELRSPDEVRDARSLRIASAAAVLMLCAGAAVAAWRAPRNLALHKPITASTVRYGSPTSLVNGSIEWGLYGLHTYNNGAQWVLIDLEASSTLREARIWNRGDGSLTDAVGTTVELSDDGKTFRRVATCKETFTQATPCRLDLGNVRARYVKVVHPVYLALSEVEVLGWR